MHGYSNAISVLVTSSFCHAIKVPVEETIVLEISGGYIQV
jgi:hypothetical protein